MEILLGRCVDLRRISGALTDGDVNDPANSISV